MKRYLALFLALCMSLSVLSGCGSGSSDSSSSDTSSADTTATDQTQDETEATGDVETYDTVNIGSTASRTVGHFDPTGLLSDNYSMPSIYLVFDRLMYIQDDEYVSDILEDFYWDDSLGDYGGTVFQFKDDVYFANGDQLTVDDFIYSLDRASQVPRTAANYAMLLMDQAEISDDNLTISIPWSKTYGAWPLIVSSLVMLDASWIEENGGDDFDWTDPALANGTGPYTCTSYVEDKSMTFEKRADWWEEGQVENQATVQTINIYYYADSTTMMVDYENGVIDACTSISSTDYDYVNADSSLGTAVAISANAVVTLVLDIDNNEALQNEALRQAICYAIDKDSIGILGYGSLYSPAVGYLSSTNQFLVDGYTYEYNPEKAKQLVDDNGLAGTELTFVCPSGMQADMAEAMQAQLAEVGITLNIEVYDAATCISMWLEEGATSMMIDSATNANNDNNANTQWNNVRAGTDFPAMRKVDEKWNDLLDSALATADTDKQAELYAEFQQYEYDQYCAIPICEWCQAYCYGASGVIQSLDLTDVANPNFRVLVTNPVA